MPSTSLKRAQSCPKSWQKMHADAVASLAFRRFHLAPVDTKVCGHLRCTSVSRKHFEESSSFGSPLFCGLDWLKPSPNVSEVRKGGRWSTGWSNFSLNSREVRDGGMWSTGWLNFSTKHNFLKKGNSPCNRVMSEFLQRRL